MHDDDDDFPSVNKPDSNEIAKLRKILEDNEIRRMTISRHASTFYATAQVKFTPIQHDAFFKYDESLVGMGTVIEHYGFMVIHVKPSSPDYICLKSIGTELTYVQVLTKLRDAFYDDIDKMNGL